MITSAPNFKLDPSDRYMSKALPALILLTLVPAGLTYVLFELTHFSSTLKTILGVLMMIVLWFVAFATFHGIRQSVEPKDPSH
jgi:predicted membrane protein